MRARWLKPEFFTDKKIGPLGMCAALVFEALWCCADDGGAAECEPVLLKGQMFMRWPEITVEAIESALEKLATAKRIERYSSGDREFALIASWDKNQPVHNASQFRYPRPGQEVTAEKTLRQQQGSGSGEAALRPSSHPIHPDTQTPVVPDTSTPKTSGPPAGSTPYLEEFEEVFRAYPKRAGGDSKREGYLAFRARVQAGATATAILEGVRRYAAYCQATDKIGTEYVKQLRTFLGKSRHYLEAWSLPRGAASAPARLNGKPGTEVVSEHVKRAEKIGRAYRRAKGDAANVWTAEHEQEFTELERRALAQWPAETQVADIMRKEWMLERIAEKIGFPKERTWSANEPALT